MLRFVSNAMEAEFSTAADSDSSAGSDVRRLEEIEAELAGVEATLRRLDEGRYGTCEVCGIVLDPDALEANPLAARCADHSS
jgi:RNA polymerase-binding transcription factor DksA